MIRRHRVIAAALSLALGVVPLAHATEADVTGAAKTMPAHADKKSTKPKPHKAPLRDPQVDRWINVAGFGEVAVYKPKVASRGLALFASGDGGWNLGVTDMAHQAAAQGFWVAGFSTPQFLKGLDSTEAACSDADGLLAKLGTDLVRQLNLPLDTRPVIIGYSSGATIAYAALAADAGQRFGGGISLGFCPDLLIRKPFCSRPARRIRRRSYCRMSATASARRKTGCRSTYRASRIWPVPRIEPNVAIGRTGPIRCASRVGLAPSALRPTLRN